MVAKQNINLSSIEDEFQQLTQNPEFFLNCDDSLHKKIKAVLKNGYDFTKSEEIKVSTTQALPELLIKNFDIEQIWQQIELQNDTVLTKSIKSIGRLLTNKNKLVFPYLETETNKTELEHIVPDDEHDPDIVMNVSNDVSATEDSEEDLDLQEDSDEAKAEEPPPIFTSKKKSIVDDEFFKLDEMENFLNIEEKKLKDPNAGNDSEESQSDKEDSIDLFESNSDDEDEKVKTAKFKDFFVSKEDTDKPKRNKFLEEMSDNEDSPVKSTLELRQERLSKKIEKIEQSAISDKPWPLKGEILAENRPQNSLLEEVVEFDLTARPPPIITEKTTFQLEDIIRQRIKDKVFDSVERKAKLVETPLEYKKKLVLDQEKSKQSLAQLYEKEFLDQREALDPENADKEESEPELHKEIKTLMRNLFNNLDALSNFHFTPKPAIPELRIVSNLPAVSMEEVAPVTISDATLLAPEEVRNKPKGDIIGKSERTTTDKNRERRKKKRKQQKHLQNRQINKNLLTGGRNSKDKSKGPLKHATKDGYIEKMNESSLKGIKSSKAFFTQLQEQVQTHISGKIEKKKNKNNKNQLVAKKIKL